MCTCDMCMCVVSNSDNVRLQNLKRDVSMFVGCETIRTFEGGVFFFCVGAVIAVDHFTSVDNDEGMDDTHST